mmetsp:Transcript_27708/g.76280  ORF Transcript_27708/g.76280 Transcript_27708/m.76280 type:complete len:939 (-) Transcript_27708:152-2968(-)|eukprot:CAMPEP_0179013448 /NCGR_PEP_ID=MMETSP0796-20121207/1732_1 /TAXON_ID=73915 /ORGANISM="Pyrodinium bahamense, Strain pbaha01" /LENGTH=938 /DNA_ID=CAMNT_0020708953 /DNA_START=21 /DNA_END=2837 /DNA_ORIENTATION=-
MRVPVLVWLAWLAFLAFQCRSEASHRELRLREQVERALRSVRSVLNSTRQPQYPADVPHAYDDKYLLTEFATKGGASGFLSVLDGLSGEPGWWVAHQASLLEWAASEQVVTLRFAACDRCKLGWTELKDLDSGEKQVTEGLGGWVTGIVKTVTTVKEHFWRFNGTWELFAFPGTRESERIVLQRGTGLHTLKTQTSKDAEANPPLKGFHCHDPVDLDLSWLLAKVRAGSLDFSVNRSDARCRTPRRNPDVDRALKFFGQVRHFSNSAAGYFTRSLFPLQRDHGLDVDAITRGEVLHPVLALFAFDPSLRADQQRPALAESFQAVLSEHRRSLARDLDRLRAIFPADGGLVTLVPVTVVALLHAAQQLAADHESAVNAVEGMLRDQLVTAVGKELSAADFTEYMDFHYRRLFRPKFAPSRFSYAVRRPGQSPEGLVSIEAPLPGAGGARDTAVPIQTVAARREAARPMHLALSAATDVAFLGERYLHPVVLHSFSGEPPQRLSLAARARQFSSFVLLLGRVLSAERFEPTAALIVKDRDDVVVPMLLDTIPAPKDFRDAIESLSPEQRCFAEAFRKMQLSSTLFGLCIIQIKPQMEEVLNLPPNSLTKEIQLTQDLMELFIEYQVPSDLLSYDGSSQADSKSKLQMVKDHVVSLLSTINASRRRELEQERERAQKHKLESVLTSAPSEVISFASVDSAPREAIQKSASRQMHKLAYMPRSMPRAEAQEASSFKATPTATPATPSREEEQRPGRAEPAVQGQRPPGEGAGVQAGTDQGGDPDYAALPGLLDQKFERLDSDASLRPTRVLPGQVWTKREAAGLLSPVRERALGSGEQARERARAFDLLDALTRSGALPVAHASLHVVLAATHGFDQALIDTIIEGNVNPIEKVERSVLIMASTLQRQPVAALIAPEQLARVRQASPGLFAEEDGAQEPLVM